MKKIFTLLVAVLAITASYAVPARPGWQSKTQPDGTQVKVQLVGDENYHYWIDENGNRISDNENRVSDNGPRKVKGITRPMKRLGELNLAPRGLVILVNFKDVSFQKDNTLAEFKDLMNGENYNYKGAPGSVRKYFSDQSNGLYTPEFDVYGPVTLPNNMKHYGGNDAYGTDLRAENMIVEACSIANALYDVDFTRYDNDGDGNVDFVYILYAGYGEADSPEENSIWPHAWDLSSAGIPANKRTFDGKKVLNYACSNELTCLYENKTIVGEMRTGIGTIVHEFSHVIGLPDLYDTSGAENYATPGWWHVMDYGPYCNDGITPPNYTIYDKYFLGWVDMENPGDEAQVLTMNEGKGYQIASSNSLLSATSTNTAYYIENRQQEGWDAHLPGHGMLIWKVTYNQSAWDQNEPNTTSNLRYMLVTAGGNANEIGYAADAFPGTKNKTSWNGVSGKPLTNIKESNGVITLTYISDGGDEGEEGEEPGEGGDEAITCAEAVAICEATGTTSTTEEYTIRGYVTEIKEAYNEQYGNSTFWMADTQDGGQVLQAYRLKPINNTDINYTVGSFVEVVGTLINYKGNTPEVNAGGTYTIVTEETPDEPGEPTEPEEPTGDAEIKGLQYCDAYYYEYEGVKYYDFDLYKDYDANTGAIIYPEIYLSVEAKSKTAINGTYDIVWAGYWINEEDAVEMDYNQPATITVQHVDNEGNYKMTGSFVGTDGATYSFDNVMNVLAYDYDNNYADITLSEEGQEPSEPEDPTEPEEPSEPEEPTIAGDVVFVPSEFDMVTGTEFEVEKDGVKMACTSGTITGDQFRFFKSQDVTISTKAGTITKIEFTCTAADDAKYGPGSFGAVDGYTYSGKVGTWTGEAKSVTLNTLFAQVRATQVVVTVSDNQGGITTGMEDVDCETGEVRKVLKDGQLLIMRDGKVWTVMGVEL